MRDAGYALSRVPADGDALMQELIGAPTQFRLGATDYAAFFADLPPAMQAAVTLRWGKPEADPHFADGGFDVALVSLGKIVIGIQPTRGYEIDPTTTYHDPDLVPCRARRVRVARGGVVVDVGSVRHHEHRVNSKLQSSLVACRRLSASWRMKRIDTISRLPLISAAPPPFCSKAPDCPNGGQASPGTGRDVRCVCA